MPAVWPPIWHRAHPAGLTPADALAVIPDLARIWSQPFTEQSADTDLSGFPWRVARYCRALRRWRRRMFRRLPAAHDGGAPGPAFRPATPAAPPDRQHVACRQCGFRPSSRAQALPRRLQRRVPEGDPARLGRTLAATSEDRLYSSLLYADSWLRHQNDVALVGAPPLKDRASRLMYRDMAAYLPGDVLVKVDRASMAVAELEAGLRCWTIASSNSPGGCRRRPS